ncbi:MAG: tetratricopeptide repeat protein [Bacteroidetes bacterium]|nr:tetratricopeptide repeat protein [Bacteroidota bacterium]
MAKLKRHICSLFVILLSSFISLSQTSKTDSLEQALFTANDTSKVKLLIRLCEAYTENTPETALIRGENALSLSKELKYSYGETNALNALASVYYSRGEENKALDFYKRALLLAQSNSFKNNVYDIYSNIAYIYFVKENYDTAHVFYNSALQIARESENKPSEIAALNSVAGLFYYQSKYDKALENYLDALKISESINNKEGIALCYMGIGNVFNAQKEYDKALRFYGDALSANEAINEKSEIANCLNNIGTVYEEKKEYDKALNYYQRALMLKEELKDKSGIENSLSNIGNVYLQINNYDKGIEYYSRAIKLSEENDNKSGLAQGYFNLGNLYAKKNDHETALLYLNKGLVFAKETGRKDFLKSCYEELADVYSKKGDYKLAFENHKLFANVKDTIYNEQSSKNVAEMQTKYETEKKEKEIALQRSELSKQAIVRNSLIAGVLLVLLIAFLTYNRYRIKKKGNELLTAINAELDVLSLVARETHNGVMICDGDGTFLYMNHGIYRLFGYTFDEIKSVFGTRLQDFSHNPTIDDMIREAIEKKTPVYYESLNTTKAGNKLWIATTLTPIKNDKGNVDKIVVIDVDIHDNKLKSLKIEDQSVEIQKSINYAKQIQEALLPDMDTIIEGLPGAFVVYKPKDVVSGDFYWYADWNNSHVIAAIDCTGHGVPGAFMSVMAHNILSQMISVSVINRPGYVLENLHEIVRASLKQHKIDSTSRDGMDIAMCRISNDKKTLEFAGAMRPIYHVRNGILNEIKGDKYAIGGYQSEGIRKFTTHKMELEKGDCIYLCSDGYADQFGGPEGKKFMTKRLKELLVSISPLSASKQKATLEKSFTDWKADKEQIDDILVIGVKV